MQSPSNPTPHDLQEWLDQIEEIGEELGYFEPLGPEHSAVFCDASTTLLVTFESIKSIRRQNPETLPLGLKLAEKKGWSTLSILAHGDTWYRHRAVYGFIDRLVDDGFFEDFDHVVFYGAGMGGYAAAAYSVASPGATVIAVQPQATLDPRVTEWDDRFLGMRRADFTSRYGFAPYMIEAADRAFVLYDPEIQVDAMHASMFNAENVSLLRCRHMGNQLDQALSAMNILEPMLEKAMTGGLTDVDFHKLYRARRDYPPFLRALLGYVDDSGRRDLAAMLCKNVVKRMNGPRFRRRLEQLKAEFEASPPLKEALSAM